MKTPPIIPTRFILSGLIAASTAAVLTASGAAQGTTNAFSAFPFTIDGQFSNGFGFGEWSDVTPSAFISSPGTTATPTSLGDPFANTQLFAALGNNISGGDSALFLMYDFLPRTTLPDFLLDAGQVIASITFPIFVPQAFGGDPAVKRNVSVLFSVPNLPVAPGIPTIIPFDVSVDLDLDGIGDVNAALLGINGAVGIGPSSLSPAPHLLVELEVPLRIPAGFADPGSPLPGGGINPATGLYDPDPVFWGASASGDDRPLALEGAPLPPAEPLQNASTASLGINPDGSVTVVPVPEPSSAALLLAGLGFLGARRRKS